jgi:hypothetical protein
MTQEQKELLLREISSRLPYGVKVYVNQSQLQNYDYKWKNWNFNEEPQEIDGVSIYGVTFGCMDMSDGVIDFEFIKPYLFPLTSMTKEQRKELHDKLIKLGFQAIDDEINPIEIAKFEINYYLENHFDYNGLIEKSLALDATGLNIYEH